MSRDPSDEQLLGFAEAMLSNFDRKLWDRAAVEQAVSDKRELWVLLYKASCGSQDMDESGG